MNPVVPYLGSPHQLGYERAGEFNRWTPVNRAF
jgi:hypothetical protein